MEPKFIVDLNVGKLAKWLRIMGFDAILFTDRDDGRMLNTALSEGRTILTRDTQVMQRRAVATGMICALLVRHEAVDDQLRQVTCDLHIADVSPFSRCLECNVLLVDVQKPAVRDRVPPYVFETYDQFKECPNCQRVYWRGTHVMAMTDVLAGLLANTKECRAPDGPATRQSA